MAKQLRHYGVMGMRWGHRKAGGGSTVTVGRGVKGAAKEVGGLAKDAIKDDIGKAKAVGGKVTDVLMGKAGKAALARDIASAKSVGNKILASKAFKTFVFDKDDVTGLIFRKSEVEKLKKFFSGKKQALSDGFNRSQIKSQDKEIKLFREIAAGLKNSKNERERKLAKEHEDAAKELEDELNDLYTPDELKKFRGG